MRERDRGDQSQRKGDVMTEAESELYLFEDKEPTSQGMGAAF